MDKSGLLIGIHKVIRRMTYEKYEKSGTTKNIPKLLDINLNYNMQCRVINKFQCPY